MSGGNGNGRGGDFDFRTAIMEMTGCGDASRGAEGDELPPDLTTAVGLLGESCQAFVSDMFGVPGGADISKTLDLAVSVLKLARPGHDWAEDLNSETPEPSAAARDKRAATDAILALTSRLGREIMDIRSQLKDADAADIGAAILGTDDLLRRSGTELAGIVPDASAPDDGGLRPLSERMACPPALRSILAKLEGGFRDRAAVFDGDIDLVKAMAMDRAALPKYDIVIANLLAGTVGSIVSPGGTGKSTFGLQMAMSVASGLDFLDVYSPLPRREPGLFRREPGRVSYLNIDDPETAIVRRVNAATCGLADPDRTAIAGNLTVKQLQKSDVNIRMKKWASFLYDLAEGRRLLIIDTFRRSHDLEENSSADMTLAMKLMEVVAAETGCAILFLHHSSKAAALGGAGNRQLATRGSGVLSDNARWQGYMATMTTDEAARFGGIEPELARNHVRFGVSKSSFVEPFQERWFRRAQEGILVPVEPFPKRKPRAEKEEPVRKGNFTR
ncbi:MAG: helicase RepA family protein [Deltaproteobacteria bacterium]|jgi:RecA-family ATPase|nr:helicase RepA family protein [Deltaproteobacteria bacterium]